MYIPQPIRRHMMQSSFSPVRSVFASGPAARCKTHVSIRTIYTRPSVGLWPGSSRKGMAAQLETGLRFIHPMWSQEKGNPTHLLSNLCVPLMSFMFSFGPTVCHGSGFLRDQTTATAQCPVSISKTLRCDSMVRIKSDSPSGRVAKRCKYQLAPPRAPPMTT